MSLTDVSKARKPVWVPCPIPEYNDESHLIVPATRENLQYVSDKSMIKEMQPNGTFERTSDNNIFTAEWMKKHWLDWKNVGLIHEDGTIEDPAVCNEKNRHIISNMRGQTFLLWLQDASRQLAAQAHQEREQQRESFREPAETPVGLSRTEV